MSDGKCEGACRNRKQPVLLGLCDQRKQARHVRARVWNQFLASHAKLQASSTSCWKALQDLMSEAQDKPLFRCGFPVPQAFVNRFAELLAEANGQERSPAGREIEGTVTQFGVWAAAATYDSNAIKMRQLLYGKLEEGARDSAPLIELAVSHPAAALQEGSWRLRS